MLLSDFCKTVGKFCPNITSHEQFIDELFTAAGAKPFISESYKRKLYTGAKLFIESQRRPLQGKDNKKTLTNFFDQSIPDDKTLDVLMAFGIPEKEAPNKKALCSALTLQMKAIIDGDDSGADDIMVISYQEHKKADVIDANQGLFNPIYPGDSVYVFSESRYEIGIYDTFSHTWIIQNTGKVTWENRKLVYRRGPKDRPEANPSEIPIPDTKPNESIKITTTFDGRGFEEITRCIWEMQDEDGDNCFPNQVSLFCVTIDAKFKRN